eukprot:PhF_6_TR40651/c0_g1_i2/m.61053/K00586/DPH5; diphthine methyl ester synthase
MPLFLIGLGLGNERDITLRGLELVRSSDFVYLEAYTAIMCDSSSLQRMQDLYGKEFIVADRYFVEDGSVLLSQAKTHRVALLVVGDPFAATTHSDLFIRCRSEGVVIEVVHNASVLTAVGYSGLQLYRFGHTVTLCFWKDGWKPDSWYPHVVSNYQRSLHTLLLLDIKVKEVSDDNLARGRMDVFEPPRFMTCIDAAHQVLAVAEKYGAECPFNESTLVVAMCRLGSPDQVVLPCTLGELKVMDPARLGAPLHCLVLPGSLHECEQEQLALFKKE